MAEVRRASLGPDALPSDEVNIAQFSPTTINNPSPYAASLSKLLVSDYSNLVWVLSANFRLIGAKLNRNALSLSEQFQRMLTNVNVMVQLFSM